MDKTQLKHLKDGLYCKHENFANFLSYIKNWSQTSSYHNKSDDKIEEDILLDIKNRAGGLNCQSLAKLQLSYVPISHGLVTFNLVVTADEQQYCVAVFYQPS
jgi:hypothetical protein